MLTELRTKSQITIPKDIVMKMGLREGDKLGDRGEGWRDRADAGAVYPKKVLDELRSEINEAKAKIAAGEAAGVRHCGAHCLKRWTVRTNELQDHLHQTIHKEPEAFERSGAGAAEKRSWKFWKWTRCIRRCAQSVFKAR